MSTFIPTFKFYNYFPRL